MAHNIYISLNKININKFDNVQFIFLHIQNNKMGNIFNSSRKNDKESLPPLKQPVSQEQTESPKQPEPPLNESDEEFFNRISNIPSKYHPDDLLIVGGNPTLFLCREMQNQMFNSCNLNAPIVKQCIADHTVPNEKQLDIKDPSTFQKLSIDSVMDLGCGQGNNLFKFIYYKTPSVIGFDKKESLITKFKEQIKETYGHKNVKGFDTDAISENIHMDDITDVNSKFLNYSGDPIDIVLCVDVLPYLDFKKIQRVLEKIYQVLKPNGKFYGTLFIQQKNPQLLPGVTKEKNKTVIEMLGKLGATYLSEVDGRNLLEKSGFHVSHYAPNGMNAFDFICQKKK